MALKIESRRWEITPCPITTENLTNETTLKAWLGGHAQTYALTTLLAHADNGIIWGRAAGTELHLTSDSFEEQPVLPPLNLQTLRECRLFGEQAELYLWRDGDEVWQTRLIRDGQGAVGETMDEYQILWGTNAVAEDNGFTLVNDGGRGNQHAPPLQQDQIPFTSDGTSRPLRLQVRHYLATDLAEPTKTGLRYITLSRLVRVCTTTDIKPQETP